MKNNELKDEKINNMSEWIRGIEILSFPKWVVWSDIHILYERIKK